MKRLKFLDCHEELPAENPFQNYKLVLARAHQLSEGYREKHKYHLSKGSVAH